MIDIEKYNIYFKSNNSNVIQIDDRENGKMVTCFVCPPINKGCDIIRMKDCRNSDYIYDFEGFVLITTLIDRKLFYRGDLIAETKR